MEASGDGTPWSARVCRVAADVIGVSGAGVMLMSGSVPQGSLCSSNSVSSLIEELQYTLGEGPSIDANTQARNVLEPNLALPAVPRWLAFTPRALDEGVRGVFAFSLGEGSARLGALNLYQDRPGPLSDDQHADAMVMSGLITNWVLSTQARALEGTLDEDLERGSNFHFVVHNAAGMVSVQLGISVAEALVRLRARAFSENRLVRALAEDVVARRVFLT
jgi:hypothetical protein